MGVFFRSTLIQPRVQAALKEALLTPPPSPNEATQQATAESVAVTADAGTEPRWLVFVGAAILLVVVLLLTVYVASAADAQPKDVTSSQLKTLSTTLITAFTSLLGAIVGVITGEAVSKKT